MENLKCRDEELLEDYPYKLANLYIGNSLHVIQALQLQSFFD